MLGVCALFAQGPLTPPGAPAPTMKTLDQVEARTPISSLPFTISAAGSFYLTKNLSVTSGDAIVINANNVTLDLNGFTISSSASPAGGTAIAPGGFLTDITILNGHIVGSFQHGIRYSGAISQLKNVRIEGMSVSGCSGDGINLGNFTSIVIDRCTVQQIGAQGIVGGSVNNSVAENCGGTGITAKTASNSVGSCSASQRGVYATTALNCIGTSVSGTGLEADSATGCRGESTAVGSPGTGLSALTANACYGLSSQGPGLNANMAQNSVGISVSGNGVAAFTATNCRGMSTSGRGLFATAANNCYGTTNSNVALQGSTVVNCVGIAAAGSIYGILSSTVSFSLGSNPGGVAIRTNIAVACVHDGSNSGIDTRYLMP